MSRYIFLMFFSISKTVKTNFPNNRKFGSFYVNLDEGWNHAVIGCMDVVYKGYLDDGQLYQNLSKIILEDIPSFAGNFCLILIDKNKIQIKSDTCRSFPIYYNNEEITNLVKLSSIAGSNVLVSVDENFIVNTKTFNVIGALTTDVIDFEQAVEKIDNILNSKIETFIKINQLPLKVFLTGGLDSMLVYSYIKKFTDNFELLNYQHFEYDYFWLNNSYDIKKYWAYNQIHHWTSPTVLVSGTPGDEFMLRSPNTANLFLRHFGTNVIELLDDPQYKNCIHYDYFNKNSNLEIFDNQNIKAVSFKNRQMLSLNLCHTTVNDWQHWHLGKTLTWTPLRELNIFKIMLQLDLESAKRQIMNGEVTKSLIAKNDASLLPYISNQKNSKDSLRGLAKLVL